MYDITNCTFPHCRHWAEKCSLLGMYLNKQDHISPYQDRQVIGSLASWLLHAIYICPPMSQMYGWKGQSVMVGKNPLYTVEKTLNYCHGLCVGALLHLYTKGRGGGGRGECLIVKILCLTYGTSKDAHFCN